MVDLGDKEVNGQGHMRPNRRSYVWKPGGDIILDPLSRVERKACSQLRKCCFWKGQQGVAHSFKLTAPVRLSNMRLADALVEYFQNRTLGILRSNDNR